MTIDKLYAIFSGVSIVALVSMGVAWGDLRRRVIHCELEAKRNEKDLNGIGTKLHRHLEKHPTARGATHGTASTPPAAGSADAG